MYFKKLRYIELENFGNRVFIFMLFEANNFFRLIDELKMHKLC